MCIFLKISKCIVDVTWCRVNTGLAVRINVKIKDFIEQEQHSCRSLTQNKSKFCSSCHGDTCFTCLYILGWKHTEHSEVSTVSLS